MADHSVVHEPQSAVTRTGFRRALWAVDLVRSVVFLLRTFWIPLAISALASAVLIIPDQSREYYRILLENSQFAKSEFYWEATGTAIAVLVMASCIAIAARVVEVAVRDEVAAGSRGWRWLMRWLPIALGSAPIFALSYGLWTSADVVIDVKRPELVNQLRQFGDEGFANTIDELFAWIENYNPYLQYAAGVVGAVGIAFVLATLPIYRAADAGAAFLTLARRGAALAVGICAAGAAVALVYLFPVALPQAFGPIGVFALFIALLSINAGLLHVWGRTTGIPFLGILVTIAILCAALDWNDNHELNRVDAKGRAVATASGQALEPPTVKDSFLAWYRNRPDREDAAYAGAKYPVYIFAAQGGGMYTAAQTLMFLVKMQAVCERFSQHLFAISGVSGGSVGATLYAALASRFETGRVSCPPIGEHSRQPTDALRQAYLASDTLLGRDYLSPLVAGALFPDFLQRFLPFVVRDWSRARALERALEASWDETAGRGHFEAGVLRAGVLGSWKPSGAQPALLLNLTEAGSGRRRLIAPFSFGVAKGYDLKFLPIARDYDVPLSAAAVASARFPWLTPAAWFREMGRDRDPAKVRVVDGAYFENSGVATAMDLIFELERIAKDNALPVEFHLIVTTSGGYSIQTFFGFGEFFAPIQSLLNARRARTYATIDLADRQLGTISTPGGREPLPMRRMQRVEINDFITPLPFGWRLSRASVFQIDRQTGLLGHCVPNDRFEQISEIKALTSADCVKHLIYHQLRGDDLIKSLEATKRN